MNNNFKDVLTKFDDKIKKQLSKIDFKIQENIQEIRLRAEKPIVIKAFSKNYYLLKSGEITENDTSEYCITSKEELEESLKKICEYSLYTYQEQINNGFITIEGGHRVGICGTAVIKNNNIINIKDVSSMNVRIAKFITNAADEIINKTMNSGLCSILICGKPGSGKTTILKDIAAQISKGRLGEIYNISVIDERGEIAGGNNEAIIKQLGNSVDVFDGYLKPEGMMMAIRTMAPDLIICDEIGTKKETKAIENILNSGVKIIATIHAGNENEIYRKPQIKKLIKSKAFEKIVILSSEKEPGKINKIISMN